MLRKLGQACLCYLPVLRGQVGWLTTLRQGEDPAKNGPGSLAPLIKWVVPQKIRRFVPLPGSRSTISWSKGPSLPLTTSFSIQQSPFSHCVWGRSSVPGINTHCDYLRKLLVSGLIPAILLLLFYTRMTTRNSRVSPRRPQICYSLVWNTFIGPPFSWLTLRILWASAYTSLLKKWSPAPWPA